MHLQSFFRFKIIFLLFSVSLVCTDATAADFIDNKVVQSNKIEATTLEFENTDTANNSPLFNLFNINGMVPDGFQLKAIRLQNKGRANFVYRIKTDDLTGDKQFCESLDIELVQNKESKYKGKLVDLSIDTSHPLDKNQIDWIIYLSLNSNQGSLVNQTCDFSFTFKAWIASHGENNGFVFQKKLTNHVTSGKW